MVDRCPKCGKATLDFPTDSIGRVRLYCWGCGWREAIAEPAVRPIPQSGKPRCSVENRPARILAVLREHGPCGVNRIARTAGMNHNDAKPVLLDMAAAGLLATLPSQQLPGYRGRPTTLYTIAAAGQEAA
jgi:hypothetical protein